MTTNRLLEYLIDYSRAEQIGEYWHRRHIFGREQIDQFTAPNILRKQKTVTDKFGPVQYGEVIKNAYILELINRNDLKRGESSGPIVRQGFIYTQALSPNVNLEFEIDLAGMSLDIKLQAPSNLREKLVRDTYDFMKRIDVRQIEAPNLTPF